MRDDQTALVEVRCSVRGPVADQLIFRLSKARSERNGAMFLIAIEGVGGISASEIFRGLPLPECLLATDACQFLVADSLRHRAERGARLDRLELLGIADQNRLRSGRMQPREHACHLPAAD